MRALPFDPDAASKFAEAAKTVSTDKSAMVSLLSELKPQLAAMGPADQAAALNKMSYEGSRVLMEQNSDLVDVNKRGFPMLKVNVAGPVIESAEAAGLLDVVPLGVFIEGMGSTPRLDLVPLGDRIKGLLAPEAPKAKRLEP